jgi:hypothetical protein
VAAPFCVLRPPPAGGGDVELVPEDIEVSATVDARFLAGD